LLGSHQKCKGAEVYGQECISGGGFFLWLYDAPNTLVRAPLITHDAPNKVAIAF
jgi:hypothetical protein